MKNYYKHLSRVQNQYTIVDILTITGLMSQEQKLIHLLKYAELVKDKEAIEYHASIAMAGLQTTTNTITKLRKYAPEGYIANNGHVFTAEDCKRYNAIQREINACLIAKMPIKDGLLDQSCIVFKQITKQ